MDRFRLLFMPIILQHSFIFRLDYMNQKYLNEQLDAEFEMKRRHQLEIEEKKTAKKRRKR